MHRRAKEKLWAATVMEHHTSLMPMVRPLQFGALAEEFPVEQTNAMELIALSLSASTRRNYSGVQKRWLAWLKQHRTPPFSSTLERLHHCVCLWATDLGRSVTPDTVLQYLSAVAAMYQEQGLLSPTFRSPQLRRILQGLKRYRFLNHGPSVQRTRLPLTAPRLKRLLKQTSSTVYDDLVFRSMCVVGYFGFLRLAEMATGPFTPRQAVLRQRHWSIHGSAAHLFIPLSKIDKFGRGQTLVLGSTKDQLDVQSTVAAMQSHPFYRNHHDAPLFQDQHGRPITRSWFLKHLSVAAKQAGLQHISGHSLRKGAATDVAACGLPPVIIQAMGRWSTDTYKIYAELAQKDLEKVAKWLVCGGQDGATGITGMRIPFQVLPAAK